MRGQLQRERPKKHLYFVDEVPYLSRYYLSSWYDVRQSVPNEKKSSCMFELLVGKRAVVLFPDDDDFMMMIPIYFLFHKL